MACPPDVLATAGVGSTVAVASGAPDCVPGAGEAALVGGEAAAGGEVTPADGEAAPAGPEPVVAGSTIDVPPTTPDGELASWFAGAAWIWLLPPDAEACTAAASVGAEFVEDGWDAAATGAGGGAAPDAGKFPPPLLPGDALDCALLRPGLPDTSFSVPANSELLPADFAGSALPVGGVSFGAGAFGAGATGVLKAGIDALMRKS